VISSISLINALKRRDKQFDPVISMELLEHTHEQGEEPDEEE
jgi:2-polyprenyl-3-methyl-5-hydroxy-6-metoxy-1,4-benzoquinol methylase